MYSVMETMLRLIEYELNRQTSTVISNTIVIAEHARHQTSRTTRVSLCRLHSVDYYSNRCSSSIALSQLPPPIVSC